MTLVRADEARAVIIAVMEANTNIMALLDDADEVREDTWSGTDFSYPNYRVRINRIPLFEDCYQNLEASIFCFSEEASSQEAEEMAGTVADELHNDAFTSSGIRFTSIDVEPIPAIKQDERTWRSEVILRSMINKV